MEFAEHEENLSGSLLIAHPALLDPNFNRSVILLSAHSPEDGSLGVIINRPLGKTLGEQSEEFAYSVLREVPIYLGGPVQQEHMLLAAWSWDADDSIFRLYFGISEEKATEMLLGDPSVRVRAFLGYSGWGKGQLESEREQHAWLVTPVDGPFLMEQEAEKLWHNLLIKVQPELAFLANAPEDPSLN